MLSVLLVAVAAAAAAFVMVNAQPNALIVDFELGSLGMAFAHLDTSVDFELVSLEMASAHLGTSVDAFELVIVASLAAAAPAAAALDYYEFHCCSGSSF